MKILFIAVFDPKSTNAWQAKSFEMLGHEVIRYEYRAIAARLGINGRDDDLIHVCRENKPDMILFSKCNKMNVRVVIECGKIGKTVLWYMDPAGNIDTELIEKMKASNYVFSARWDGYNESKKYNSNSFRIHEGFDSLVHKPFNVPRTRDICFIGEARSYRKPYLDAANVPVFNNVFNYEHAKLVSETKINLGLTEGDGTSDRTYKIMAAGGFLLTMPWEKIEDEFELGIDLVTFDNVDVLKYKIQYYLTNELEREAIAKNGMETVKKYNDINFVKSILKEVTK